LFFLYLIYVELRREVYFTANHNYNAAAAVNNRCSHRAAVHLARLRSRSADTRARRPSRLRPRQGAGGQRVARRQRAARRQATRQPRQGAAGRRHNDGARRRSRDRAHRLSYDGSFDNVLVSKTRAEGCLVFLRKVNPSGRGSLFDADPRPSIAYSNRWTDHRRNASGWCNTWH
jgi:hypothetical protein